MGRREVFRGLFESWFKLHCQIYLFVQMYNEFRELRRVAQTDTNGMPLNNVDMQQWLSYNQLVVNHAKVFERAKNVYRVNTPK